MKSQSIFCPICNKGRKKLIPNTILIPSGIEDVAKCAICKRMFKDGKEVTIEVKEKPKPGMDLRKLIRDWYRCPSCGEIVVGFLNWAAHTWQKHGLGMREFEAKYGKPEKSWYGIDFKKYFNPSKRENEE